MHLHLGEAIVIVHILFPMFGKAWSAFDVATVSSAPDLEHPDSNLEGTSEFK